MQHIKYKPTNKGYEMNIEYKITFGTEIDHTGTRMRSNPNKLRDLSELIAHDYGGYSLIKHEGGYIYKNKQLVTEKSLTYIIIGKASDRDNIYELVDYIKYLYNQESVLLVETKINAIFI